MVSFKLVSKYASKIMSDCTFKVGSTSTTLHLEGKFVKQHDRKFSDQNVLVELTPVKSASSFKTHSIRFSETSQSPIT